MGGWGMRSAPTSAPHFPWKEALSGCQPWRRSVPAPGPDHRQPCWATARGGGGVLSPQLLSRLALGTPPRPQIQAASEASSKQVRSFSTRPAQAGKPPTWQGYPILQSPIPGLLPRQPWAPNSLHSLPSKGPGSRPPNTCWRHGPG